MEKLDLFKHFKKEYAAKKKPMIVDIGHARYLSIEGVGAPGDDIFTDKVGALYAMAYTIKMTRKNKGLQDYVICKLECLYLFDDENADFSSVDKNEWKWRLLIRTPDFVSQQELNSAAAALVEKGKTVSVKKVTLFSDIEGKCLQMLHIGPYDQEQETIKLMLNFGKQHNLQSNGNHHEIYISDPRRVPAERLKTIIRLPVREKMSEV